MDASDPAPTGRPARAREPWRDTLSAAIRDPRTLLRRVGLPESLLPGAAAGAEQFPVLVPEPFLARIRPGDPDDPLLRQVLPVAREAEPVPGYGTDPLEENHALEGRGLLRKYSGRALVVATGACAVNCRYCFRRHFAYAEDAGWRSALAHLDAETGGGRVPADPSTRELILSGGDPLTLDDDALEALLGEAESRPELERLRIHSRLPIVVPERVTPRLVERLRASRLDVVMVVHANHAREIDAGVREAFAGLREASSALLNQSVLLRGVNDSADALVELSETLFAAGCLPYYLHLLDPVAGAAHFHVPDEEARAIWTRAGTRLPGYLVPRLARETPGAEAKTLMAPAGPP